MDFKRAERFIIRHKAGFISLSLCIVALVIAFILHPVYETNDDIAMESLLFGSNGENGTSFLAFINRVLGCALFFLVSVLPGINWYFAMHYATCLVSMFILSKTFISRFKTNGIFISIVVVFAALETLCAVQFTKTAAFASVSGAIGLIYELRRDKKNPIALVSCIGLIVMGSLIRFESLLMISPFIFFVFLFELVDAIKKRDKCIKSLIIYPVVTMCLVLSFYAAGNIINDNTPGSKEFYIYNTSRSAFVDYYPEIDPEMDFETDSLSEILMVSFWMHNDPEVFSPERLEELSQQINTTHNTPDKAVVQLFNSGIVEILSKEILSIFILIVALLICLFSNNRLCSIPLFVSYWVLEWYLTYSGRYYVHRVQFGLHYALLISLLFICTISFAKVKMPIKMLLERILMPFVILGGIAFSFISIHKVYEEYDYQKRSNDYLVDATSNTEYHYMIHPLATGINEKKHIYDLPSKEDRDGNFYMGGWEEGITIPGLEGKSYCSIDGNPWVECIDSDTIRLVMPKKSGNYYIQAVAYYIGIHYDRKVTGVLEYENEEVLVYSIVSVE